MTNYLQLQKEKLDLNEINDLITNESCGGVAIFIGTTRNFFEDKNVISLEYEAYDSMALKSMKQICDELRLQWQDLKHIAIYHRLGVVPVREASVIIGVSSPHRQSCQQAVQLAIDRLKQIVPIWKKERYADMKNGAANRPHHINNRANIDFNSCAVPVEFTSHVPTNLVQIRANEIELRRRINRFVEKKREEINEHNMIDFIETDGTISNSNMIDPEHKQNDSTCARIRSSVYRNKDSTSHLRIHRVKNDSGPVTRDFKIALYKLTNGSNHIDEPIATRRFEQLPDGIKERVADAENAVGIIPMPGSIYSRLKVIESRINYLETISPEYVHFLPNTFEIERNRPIEPKNTYTLQDVNLFIESLERTIQNSENKTLILD